MAEIDDAAEEFGLDKGMMHRFADIESGHNPRARTGSYHGLFQLSVGEFNRNGGGNIYNARDNSRAAARKISRESDELEDRLGRKPEGWELYMVHQQGSGGFAAHQRNPDAPAWQNMYSTGEGQQKGQSWAQKAIWGNIPTQDKAQFGSVRNVSSQDFMDLWERRFNKGGPVQLSEQHERAGLPEQADAQSPGGDSTQAVYGKRLRITVDKPQRSLASVERDTSPPYQSPFTASDVAAMPVPTAPEINLGRLKVPNYG